MKTKDILEILNTIAPFDIAEEWDNCGLQAGNKEWEIKKILIGLDVTMPLMIEAQKSNADLVLTHHPLLIQPENIIDFNRMPGSAIEICAKHEISIVSAHTNLDKARQGLNDYFAAKIGLENTRVFVSEQKGILAGDQLIGIGRIGQLNSVVDLGRLSNEIKKQLGLKHIRVTGDMNQPVKRIAICTGSGGSLVKEFIASGADVYITGDMKYHDARQIEEYSRAMIDVGHFGSEHMAIDLLYERLNHALQKEGLDIQLQKFKKEKDPFTIV